MQFELKNGWCYLYDGRLTFSYSGEPKKDPFSKIHAFRVEDVKGIAVDHEEHHVKFFVAGHMFPILCDSENGPNSKLNWFFNFYDSLHPLFDYLKLDMKVLDVEPTWYAELGRLRRPRLPASNTAAAAAEQQAPAPESSENSKQD